MIILGVDPGLAATGYGIVREDGRRASGLKVLGYGCIKTKTQTHYPQRLKLIYLGLKKIVDQYRPDVIAMEEIFFSKNAKTAISVGQAQGMVFLAAADADLQVIKYTPLHLKLTLAGHGRAKKSQVQEALKELLNMDKVPRPADASDALATAVCHALLMQKADVRKQGIR